MILSLVIPKGLKQDLRLGLGMFSASTAGLDEHLQRLWESHLDEMASSVMLPSSTTEVNHSQQESREIPLELSIWL